MYLWSLAQNVIKIGYITCLASFSKQLTNSYMKRLEFLKKFIVNKDRPYEICTLRIIKLQGNISLFWSVSKNYRITYSVCRICTYRKIIELPTADAEFVL